MPQVVEAIVLGPLVAVIETGAAFPAAQTDQHHHGATPASQPRYPAEQRSGAKHGGYLPKADWSREKRREFRKTGRPSPDQFRGSRPRIFPSCSSQVTHPLAILARRSPADQRDRGLLAHARPHPPSLPPPLGGNGVRLPGVASYKPQLVPVMGILSWGRGGLPFWQFPGRVRHTGSLPRQFGRVTDGIFFIESF